MSSTFNPSNDFKEGPEKEWAAKLGALDWDNTRIVFTKRSLIEFLKYTGVSVDPNFHDISKLPRYAVMGKLTDIEVASESATGSTAPSTESGAPAVANNTTDFRPSRRVREVPGGRQSFFLGDDTDETFDAPATKQSVVGAEVVQTLPQEEETTSESSGQYRPSRRVRTAPGGPSQLATLWGDDEAEAEPQFRPTRRVRERPGGVDSIADIL